jgi:hypothetical protein
MEMTFAEYVQSTNPDLIKELDNWEFSLLEGRVWEMEGRVEELERRQNILAIALLVVAIIGVFG